MQKLHGLLESAIMLMILGYLKHSDNLSFRLEEIQEIQNHVRNEF